MSKPTVIQVPFDRDGNLMHYPSDVSDHTQPYGRQADGTWLPPTQIAPDWRDNTPFAAQLRLVDTRRGRSAAYFMWTDGDGHRYPMFLSDMADLIRSGMRIEHGQVDAMWVVAKRGQNYGVRLAGEELVS